MDVLHEEEDWEEEDRALDAALRGNSKKKVITAMAARYGRTGMLDEDLFDFQPYSIKLWTVVQLKNRINWLKKQKASIIGKEGKAKEAEELQRKVRMYTKELFKRFSPERLAEERAEVNRKRRLKRQRAKQRAKVALVDRWFAERKAKRKALKWLKTPSTRVAWITR